MFKPPFCPYAGCPFHTDPIPQKWWYSVGFHSTKTFGRVPRFRCGHCGRTFSVQSFRVNYYAKRLIALGKLERLSSSSMSIRALSREFRCSCGTISNRIDRIARQGVMLHTTLRKLADPLEPVCFDGLVNFDRSQYFPNDIVISIAGKSRFILGLTHAMTRRAGSMREDQKRKRDALYTRIRFERKAVERSFTEHLDLIARERSPALGAPFVLITDEKPEYKRALERHHLFKSQVGHPLCDHVTVSSELPRTFDNPLFPSNYIDREARKDQANFRRETTCFSRNGADCMTRLLVYSVWHNYEKRYLIKASVDRTETHAEVAGIQRSLVRSMRRRMFTWRAFLSHLDLSPMDQKLWTKTVYSPWEGRVVGARLPRFALG